MNEKLQECMNILNEICCDVEERFLFGLLRVRHLLRDVLAERAACAPKPSEPPDDEDDYCYLGETPDAVEPGK